MSQEDINKARAEAEASLRPALKPDPEEQSKEALNKAIKDSNEILVTASTIGPIHKNTLTLSRTKLFAEKKSGIRSVSVMSDRIEDVLNINGEVGPVSGFIDIATKFTSPGNPYRIGPFHRKDVLKLKRIIQGYVLALQEGVNTKSISTTELINMLYELGEDDPTIK